MENNQQIEQFNKIKSESLLIVEEVKNLTINGIDDKRGYEAVRTAKMRVVKQINFIKEERLNITRVFDNLKKKVMKLEDEQIEVLEPTKNILAERQKEIDDAKEKIAIQKSIPERIERLASIKIEGTTEFLITMTDKQFNDFFLSKKEEYLIEQENQLKAEQERQRLQKEANEREAQRLIDIENARKEEAEKARKQAEIDKINAEKEKELAIKKAEEEKALALKKAEEEREIALQKIKAEKQAIIDKQKKEEAERRAAEEEYKKEVEEREKRVKEEAQALEKKKRFQKFLVENNYNKEAGDNLIVEEDKIILTRVIAIFNK